MHEKAFSSLARGPTAHSNPNVRQSANMLEGVFRARVIIFECGFIDLTCFVHIMQ